MNENNEEFKKLMEQRNYESMRYDQSIKVKRYEALNTIAKRNQILFTGSSLMELFPIEELRMTYDIKPMIYNRGIGGYTTDDFLDNIHTVLLDLAPCKVFINIGTNDISDRPTKEGNWLTHLISNYTEILRQLKQTYPSCIVYLMSYYPVNTNTLLTRYGGTADTLVRSNPNVQLANEAVKNLAEQFSYHYIDVNTGLTDTNGELKAEYTMDGIHMYPAAYIKVLNNLTKYLSETN